MAGGMKRKGGGRLTIEDFLPEFAKEEDTPEKQEEKLKKAFRAMAARSNTDGSK